MTFQATLALLAWIPICLFLFTRLAPPRALITAFIAGWLFLPQSVSFPFKGLPDYNKTSATSYIILLAVLLFDTRRLTTFKFSWLDLPMLIWCLCPLITTNLNGLGMNDGLLPGNILLYGVPYFLGRIYLNNLAALRKLAVGILIGGLIYLPLCLYEIFASPQLHRIVYGYQVFDSEVRWGGYRPIVFMQGGLSVGMWMMAVTLIAIWLWQAGTLKKLWDIPFSWLVILLGVTFVLIRSYAAYLYMLYGIFILLAAKRFRSALPLMLLILAISFYLFIGVIGRISPKNIDQINNITTNLMGQKRAGSLKFRLDSEQFLANKARQKPIFGWGAGRNRIIAENERGDVVDAVVTDSLWIIVFGQLGAVGLTAIFSVLLLPVLIFIRRYPALSWVTPQVAPAAALSVVLTFFAVDCLLNAMVNPVYFLASGAIVGLVVQQSERPKGTASRTLTAEEAQWRRGQTKRLNAGRKSEV
jgi:O-antigen ligase